MNRFHAEVYVTVSKLGSYRKAAEKLGYTQAGISYIIRGMEEEAGIPFFTREYGGVKLTPEGEVLLPAMQKLLEYEKVLTTKIDEIKGLKTGKIKVLSFNTVIVCWLPELIESFKKKYPGIDIEILSCEGAGQAIQMLKNKEADCGFIATDIFEGIEGILLHKDTDVVVVAENHPLANANLFSNADLKKYPFIGYPEDEAPYVYQMARKKGIHFNQIMTVSNDYGSFSMISRNLGFGIYPKMIVDNCMFPVKAIPMELGSSTPISIAFGSKKSLSIAAKTFVEYVLHKYGEDVF